MKKILFSMILMLLTLLSFTLGVSADGSLTVQIRYADAVPFTDAPGYTVSAYVSVLDSAGTPLKGLTSNSFRIHEDSNLQTVKDVRPANDEPISLVLLMDMSGSMLGQALYDSSAASRFLEKLSQYDRSAVVSFNETVTTLHRFTTDRSASANAASQAVPENGKGSCLYDALYNAMEMTLTESEGRRAVVLFTDGKDELADGSKCSVRNVTDVENFAAQNHIPVYTIGLGTQTDDNELKHIGETTGGSFTKVDTGTDMNAAFTRIYDQMVNDYKVIYESSATGGTHTILIAAERGGIPGQNSCTLTFPAMPTIMRFQSPAEDASLSGKALISVAFISQSAEISSVEYYANGQYLGKAVSYPYDLSWDVSDLEPGTVTLEAIAYGRTGAELARHSMMTAITAVLPTEEPTPTTVPTETPAPTATATAVPVQEKKSGSNAWIPAVLGGLIVLAAILIFRLVRSKNVEEYQGESSAAPAAPPAGAAPQNSGAILAVLEVKNSDDRAFIGSRFYVTKLPFTLGRSSDNDAVFSQSDTAVGRHHAILEERSGQITIRDLNSRYGTFLNGRKLSEFPITLNNGAEIRLGSRTLLRYTRTGSVINGSGEEATVDKLELLNDPVNPPAAPAAIPSGDPSADTVRTNNLRGGDNDETVRTNLISGRSDHNFGGKQ